jgi:hypothetical protein
MTLQEAHTLFSNFRRQYKIEESNESQCSLRHPEIKFNLCILPSAFIPFFKNIIMIYALQVLAVGTDPTIFMKNCNKQWIPSSLYNNNIILSYF